MADEAAIIDEDAASMAEVAADEAAMPADIAASEAPEAIGAAIVGAGVTTVVLVMGGSSFLLQAANDTAAASETINKAVFMFLLGIKGSNNFSVIVGTLSTKSPIVRRHTNAEHCGCLAFDYRRVRGFP